MEQAGIDPIPPSILAFIAQAATRHLQSHPQRISAHKKRVIFFEPYLVQREFIGSEG